MRKPPIVIVCSILGLASYPATHAGSYSETRVEQTTSSAESIAEREIARRQEAVIRAEAAIEKAEIAMSEKDYEVAVAQYKLACDLLPESDATKNLREKALEGFCEASYKLAEQRIAQGRYQDAQMLATTVLSPQYNPECDKAIKLLANLEDPDYYNKTITPKFYADVEQVKELFVQAEGFKKTGRYDLAFKRYEQILNIDPYNIAARKGQEEVDFLKQKYDEQAYAETRARLTERVTRAWEMPVQNFNLRKGDVVIGGDNSVNRIQYLTDKLNRIVLPKLELREATLREAIAYLRQKSQELDPETDPTKGRGVSIVIKTTTSGATTTTSSVTTPAEPEIPGLTEAPATTTTATVTEVAINPENVRINVEVSNIPLIEALKYVVQQANMKIKIDPYAVVIVPQSESTEAMITQEFRVPAGFISAAPSAGGGSLLDTAPTGGDATGAGQNLAVKATAKEFLEERGVQFPAGASAILLAGSSKLIAHNTQANLDLIEQIIKASTPEVPVMVHIESKFVEITQNNLKELGFDWLLGQANIPGTYSVFAGGGTSGTAPAVNPVDFPFSTTGQAPVTAGNRSGSLAIGANAIDALLLGQSGASALAPGFFSIAGALTDPQFQVVIRALDQKKGIDLLSAPSVTTKSGNRAVIEIVRELRYPTEFDPPQIPTTFGNNGGGETVVTGGINVSSSSFPVTPTTPTAFEVRNTGVTLEVEPNVGPDNYTIDLTLQPQVVEFEGFINYGSPVLTTSTNPFTGITSSNVLTPNVINQPVFSTRKVTTQVTVWDGQTVILGGLIREDVQKVEDKVPIIGDIPLVGRLFRSSVDQHVKRNLIVFVTARLLNPGGQPINFEEEEEELLTPMEVAPPPVPEAPLFEK